MRHKWIFQSSSQMPAKWRGAGAGAPCIVHEAREQGQLLGDWSEARLPLGPLGRLLEGDLSWNFPNPLTGERPLPLGSNSAGSPAPTSIRLELFHVRWRDAGPLQQPLPPAARHMEPKGPPCRFLGLVRSVCVSLGSGSFLDSGHSVHQ